MLSSHFSRHQRLISFLVLLITLCDVHSAIPKLGSKFVPAKDAWSTQDLSSRMSIVNMTCDFFTQPLNHFVPRGRSPTYEQRYCVYDGYASADGVSPILFYTGNESPLEQYINHTGLMWELAPKLKARVVFVEHRYEGQSIPNVSSQCLSYGSTIQALADYADILQLHLNPGAQAPVIAFGGSYGGMLSGWMRMKYPHLISGAIAASAPIGGFPQSANFRIDGSARVLFRGMQQSYPPDKKRHSIESPQETDNNYCALNLQVTWPLITWLVEQGEATFLKEVFSLCEPYTQEEADPLVSPNPSPNAS